MNMVDMKNRWVYKGSMTTPPCTQDVYWNVLHTVYPIKKEHLDRFKTQMDRTLGLTSSGNWRKVQDYTSDTHKAAVITSTTFGSETDSSNDINYNINVNIYN